MYNSCQNCNFYLCNFNSTKFATVKISKMLDIKINFFLSKFDTWHMFGKILSKNLQITSLLTPTLLILRKLSSYVQGYPYKIIASN